MACTAAAAAPGAGDAAARQFTLGNGMQLIVQPDRRAPTAVQMLWVRAGAIDEVGGTSGVAYLRRMLDIQLFPELWALRTTL